MGAWHRQAASSHLAAGSHQNLLKSNGVIAKTKSVHKRTYTAKLLIAVAVPDEYDFTTVLRECVPAMDVPGD